MPNGRMSPQAQAQAQARVAGSEPAARRPLTNVASPAPAPNDAPEGILMFELTDDEEDTDHSYDPSRIHSIINNATADVVRTGESSRLRRRGAVHGRRPQLPYVTLLCGAPLPWRFKFEHPHDSEPTRPFSIRSLLRRCESLQRPSSSAHDPCLEFPSTGCRTLITDRAYASPAHHVYSAQVISDSVRRVDRSYLDMEQKGILVEVLMNSWGQLDWQGLACANCGNIIGFRYAPALFDEQGKLVRNSAGPAAYTPKERFSFFTSAVTSSKPYDFTTQQHHSYPYHWRYLEPLGTTSISISSPILETSLQNGTRTQNRLQSNTTVSDSQGVRPYRYRDHPTPVSHNSRNHAPFASYDEAGSQSPQEDTRASLSFQPLLSPEELLSLEGYEFGVDHASRQSSDIPWDTWSPNPAFIPANTIHEDLDPIHHSSGTRDDGDTVRGQRGQPSPWQTALTLEPQPLDHVVHRALWEAIFPMETVDASLGTLPDQHAPSVLPVGDEHEPSGSAASHAVNEVQASSDRDYYAEILRALHTPLSSQQPFLRSPDIEISDASLADSSQAHHGSERVHDNMAQSESDIMDVPRQEGANDPPSELDATVQSGTDLGSFSFVPSTTMLPTPLPVAYESPATIVDLEASNETTGEMENVGILIQVSSPPSDATSGFGSAVVVPSLAQSSTDSTRAASPIGLEEPSSTALLNQFDTLLEQSPLNINISQVSPPETPHVSSDATQDPDAEAVSTEEPDGEDQEHLFSAPSSYHHYTPPLPPLTSSSLPDTPLVSPLTLAPPFTPDPASLLAFLESESAEGLMPAEPGVSSERRDMENLLFSQLSDHLIEASVQRNGSAEASQSSHLEQTASTESDHSGEGARSAVEERTSRSSSPSSPSASSPSSRDVIPAAPASHPQPLPVSPPIIRETMAVGLPPTSRRFSRHTPTMTSSPQPRSSSRRSWRTPRELTESPGSVVNDDDDDVESSRSRLRSRSRREVTESVALNESRFAARVTQVSPSASRRIRGGHSRPRRRRLSSSSRRDSHLSPASMSASGPSFPALPSDMIRFPSRLQMLMTAVGGAQSQLLAAGGDPSHLLQSRIPTSPELIRRGSLPNIHRPRLGGLVRRDSLPALPVQRRPLADLTATFRQQPTAISVSDLSSRAPSSPAAVTREPSNASNRRHWGERVVLNDNRSRENEQDVDTSELRAREEELDESEQENHPINDPEDVLTPRPRRHTTMPVFIPSPPSDSESELEDSVQLNDAVAFSRGLSLFPWMPWESCWQDHRLGQQQISLENGLRIEAQAVVAGESDDNKED